MEGKLLFECKGKITGHQETVENGITKTEASITGSGIFAGSIEITESWTYWYVKKPDSTSYGEAQGKITTKDGEVATGNARIIREPGDPRFWCSIVYTTNSKNKLAVLNDLHTVDESGSMKVDYDHKSWDAGEIQCKLLDEKISSIASTFNLKK